MKSKAILMLSWVSVVQAGQAAPEAAKPAGDGDWMTPLVDIRMRYEYADIDGKDSSNALTTRERLGLKFGAWAGFSALVEGEFSQALGPDYNGGAAGATPFDPKNSQISDPQTNELNQAYIQYSGNDTVARVGRQRIIYDKAAFIGNVGWRQNEQTYDGVSISNKSIDGLALSYAYVNRVNRVFGSDAVGVLSDVPGELHFFNVLYSGIKEVTLGGYAYLMNFQGMNGWDNNTYGIHAKGDLAGVTLYGEFAVQTDAGPLNDTTACYYHVNATKTFGGHSVTVGVEQLDAGFQTPLATLHSYNGFAEAFLAQRAAGTHGGLTDLYCSYTMPVIWDMKWTNVIHAFGDDGIATDRGWEIDSMLVKKFDEHFSAIAEAAHFETEDKPRCPNTTRFSLQLDYTF